MSFHVDPKTLLFDALDVDEVVELEGFVTDLVLKGTINITHQAFRQWAKAANYDDRQILLIYTTAFPQRALLSLTLFWRHRSETLENEMLEMQEQIEST